MEETWEPSAEQGRWVWAGWAQILHRDPGHRRRDGPLAQEATGAAPPHTHAHMAKRLASPGTAECGRKARAAFLS